MLKVDNLFKTYGNSQNPTIKNINFEVKEGEIFGFLGSNGAGKTTTIKCICGILPFEIGDVYIDGISLKEHPKEAKLKLAYISDNHAVFERLTGREYVNHIANLYNTPKEQRDRIVNQLLEAFNLKFAYDRPIKSYSHGMKQKINVIAGLVHEPKLWVLDEPLLGLDPQSSIELKRIMKQHAQKGNTVFFSSHILEVVESLCDRVGILNKGTLVAVIDLHELREQGKSLEEIFVRLTSQNDDGTGTTAMPAQTTDMEEAGEKAIETTNPSQKNNNSYKIVNIDNIDYAIEEDDDEKDSDDIDEDNKIEDEETARPEGTSINSAKNDMIEISSSTNQEAVDESEDYSDQIVNNDSGDNTINENPQSQQFVKEDEAQSNTNKQIQDDKEPQTRIINEAAKPEETSKQQIKSEKSETQEKINQNDKIGQGKEQKTAPQRKKREKKQLSPKELEERKKTLKSIKKKMNR